MATSPDNSVIYQEFPSYKKKVSGPPTWLHQSKELLAHLGTMATVAALSHEATDLIYKANYQLFSHFTSDLSVFERFHSTNLGMAILGGVIAGDFLYRAYRKSVIS